MQKSNSVKNLKIDKLINQYPHEVKKVKKFFYKLDEVAKVAEGKKGIYFFIKNYKIIYVGKSNRNLFERVKKYSYRSNKEERKVMLYLKTKGYKNIDLTLYILDPTVSPIEIEAMEIYYIKTLNPTLNERHKIKSTVGTLKQVPLKTKSSLLTRSFVIFIIISIFLILPIYL